MHKAICGWLSVVLLATLGARLASGAAFELAGGTRTGCVVLAAHPEVSSILAAEELTNYVFKVSGRGLSGDVVIGTLQTLPDCPADVRGHLMGMPQPEASWTGLREGKLWFVGKEEAAELHAVYHFLETRLGVRWFQIPTPEDPGEYVPQCANVTLEDFSEYRAPDFGIRRLDNTGAAYFPLPERSIALATRLGYQVPPTQQQAVPYAKTNSPMFKWYAPRLPRRMLSLGGWHNTFARPNPAKTAFAAHPEYFALVDGKRTAAEHQYCLSNTGLRQSVVDDILSHLDATGGKGEYLFGQADVSVGLCECDACRALDGSNENDRIGPQQKATRFFKTVNWIADRVFARYPNADLRMWAYATYREIPSVAIDPRIKMVWFCPHGRCYGHYLDDPACARNAKMLALMKEWQKIVPQVYTYEYLNCTPHLYCCCEAESAHDLRYMKANGIVGWKEEIAFTDQKPAVPSTDPKRRNGCIDTVPSNWQWLYVTGHLLWNTSLDLDAMLDDVESKYYGVAYPAMKRYQAYRRKLWRENPNCMGYPIQDERRPTLLDRVDAREKLTACLDEADRLAANDPVVRYRVSRDRLWLQRWWIDANEELKKRRGNLIRLRQATGPIVIDGDPSDSAWGGATYVEGLKRAYVNAPECVAPPETLATTFGLTYDAENIYLLAVVKEPAPEKMKCGTDAASVWNDDCIELMLYPPAADNRYYHFAVNAKGTVYGAATPGALSPDAFGATARVRVREDRYVVELKIPAQKLHPLVAGETWRVQLTRNRLVKDDLTPKGDGRWSLDGAAYDSVLSFRNLEIGKAYLKNGSLDTLGQNGLPASWHFVERPSKAIKRGNGYAVELGRTMWTDLPYGALAQADRPRRLKYSFKASGTGVIYTSFLRFTDTPNIRAPHGYDRKRHEPNGKGSKFSLSETEKVYAGEYTVPAGEWAAICISVYGGVAIVDDVCVEPCKE